MLDGSARQSEIGSGRQHVAVAGPHLTFSGLVRGRQMHGVGSANEEIRGAETIRALVLRSNASLTGMRFHRPSRICSEKRVDNSRASRGVNEPSRMRR